MRNFLLIVICLIETSVFAAEGGGGSTGNGYPTEPIVETKLPLLPAKEALYEALENISGTLPSIGYSLIDWANEMEKTKFPNHRKTHIVSVDKRNEIEFASYSISDPVQIDGRPQSAKIVFWKNFFDLPINADGDNVASQVKVILHELIHIVFSKNDEEKTQRITESLYRISRSEVLGQVELSTLVRDLDRPEDDGVAYRVNWQFWKQLEVYLRANEIKKDCSEIAQVTLEIAGKKIVFPSLPQKIKNLLGVDPFYRAYRDYCFNRTLEGAMLSDFPEFSYFSGDVSRKSPDGMFYNFQYTKPFIHRLHPLLKHPFVAALVLNYLSEGIPQIVLSSQNNELMILDAKGRDLSLKLAERDLLSTTELQEIISGYSDWVSLYKENHLQEELPYAFSYNAQTLREWVYRVLVFGLQDRNLIDLPYTNLARSFLLKANQGKVKCSVKKEHVRRLNLECEFTIKSSWGLNTKRRRQSYEFYTDVFYSGYRNNAPTDINIENDSFRFAVQF